MEIAVFWTNFAKNELRKIFDYHKNTVSLKIALQISRQIIAKTTLLGKYPEIGVIEELLINRPQKFRFIVSTNYKIIYWINIEKNRIEVVDVFDTRQNPNSLLKNR